MNLTEERVRNVLEVVDKGLIKGIGMFGVPGKVCVEQAVCLGLGLPLSDAPSCVSNVVRMYKSS